MHKITNIIYLINKRHVYEFETRNLLFTLATAIGTLFKIRLYTISFVNLTKWSRLTVIFLNNAVSPLHKQPCSTRLTSDEELLKLPRVRSKRISSPPRTGEHIFPNQPARKNTISSVIRAKPISTFAYFAFRSGSR